MLSLDLLSTSQKIEVGGGDISPHLLHELEFHIEQSYAAERASKCINHAPYICFKDNTNAWRLVQGCCNSWTCPRCGNIRAREEYGKIVNGARELSQHHTLYFVTITCRGKDLDLKTSDDDYYTWTNRLLSAWRARCKAENGAWHYVQVTERQRRGAAHSHLITTHFPNDAKEFMAGEMLPSGIVAKHDCLYSEWFVKRNISAGLGKATDCTIVHSAVGVAVYVAKYLFKDAQLTLWPKGWKRIRYSQSWPKLPERAPAEAFPIIKYADWMRVSLLGATVHADSVETYEKALSMLVVNVVPPIKG